MDGYLFQEKIPPCTLLLGPVYLLILWKKFPNYILLALLALSALLALLAPIL